MKKASFILLFALIAICVSILVSNNKSAVYSSVFEVQKLNLKIESQKAEYVLGEKIRLDVEVSNEGSQDILSTDPLAKTCAYLHIYVSADNKTYSEYFGPGFQVEGCEISLSLKGGESHKSATTLLWNGNLEFLRDKKSRDNRPVSDYAISKPGVYFIKAALSFSNESLPKIETAPIQISVKQPAGDELAVWNLIKDKGEIAYFIQNAYFKSANAEERERLCREIKEIVAKYPDSIIANQMKQSFERFCENEPKRKESIQKN